MYLSSKNGNNVLRTKLVTTLGRNVIKGKITYYLKPKNGKKGKGNGKRRIEVRNVTRYVVRSYRNEKPVKKGKGGKRKVRKLKVLNVFP